MCDLDDTIFYLWKVIWGQECNFTHQLVHFQWCFSFHPQCNVKVLIRILPRGGIKLNEFRINFYRIFWNNFHLSNQSNFEWIHILMISLQPTCSWSQIEPIKFELIFIKFFEYFLTFLIDWIPKFWHWI